MADKKGPPATQAARPALPAFIGQPHVVEYFRRVGPGGIAHAYLFHGPRGVGKRTFARMLAWTLNCERPGSFPLGYCGTCGPCVRGINGSSGDIIEVNRAFIETHAAKNRTTFDDVGMEEVRQVIGLMELRSYEGGRAICILPDFDATTMAGVPNALLKELEESGRDKLFLLTTELEESILPTVRSRAVSLRFTALPERDVATALASRYGEPPDRAAALARRAQGSLGDALAARDDAAAGVRDAAREWLLACVTWPDRVPPLPELPKEGARDALTEILRQARVTARDVMVGSVAGPDAVFDREMRERYAQTATPGAAWRGAAALTLVDEAVRLSNTNIAPATILGWLQVQLRSIS